MRGHSLCPPSTLAPCPFFFLTPAPPPPLGATTPGQPPPPPPTTSVRLWMASPGCPRLSPTGRAHTWPGVARGQGTAPGSHILLPACELTAVGSVPPVFPHSPLPGSQHAELQAASAIAAAARSARLHFPSLLVSSEPGSGSTPWPLPGCEPRRRRTGPSPSPRCRSGQCGSGCPCPRSPTHPSLGLPGPSAPGRAQTWGLRAGRGAPDPQPDIVPTVPSSPGPRGGRAPPCLPGEMIRG